MCSSKVIIRLNFLIFLVISSIPVYAGFLDMPEITETPEFERKSMLRDIDIPGVKDRDPDPQAGPRLAVKMNHTFFAWRAFYQTIIFIIRANLYRFHKIFFPLIKSFIFSYSFCRFLHFK